MGIGSGEPSADGADSAEPSGRIVVLWLFVALSAATAIVLVYFATIVDAEFRPRIYVALVGNLALPMIAWYVYKHLPRHRAPRH